MGTDWLTSRGDGGTAQGVQPIASHQDLSTGVPSQNNRLYPPCDFLTVTSKPVYLTPTETQAHRILCFAIARYMHNMQWNNVEINLVQRTDILRTKNRKWSDLSCSVHQNRQRILARRQQEEKRKTVSNTQENHCM